MRPLANEPWFFFAALVLVLLACKSKNKPAEEQPGAPAAASGSTPSAASATQGVATTGPNSKCPAGRWSYDYSDQALEAMMAKLQGAKVVKKEGAFLCEVSEGTQATATCSTQGKPVLNVVEANQGGMKMVISIKMDGRATSSFTLEDGQRMKVHSSDIKGLKITTEVKLGGKAMPFPTDKMISIFGDAGSTISYKCEGGNLLLNGQPAGAEPVWQRLEPAK